MPITTVEVRWFGDGYVRPSFVDQLRSLHGFSCQPSQRCDRYLQLQNPEYGIKEREGSFEVKQRVKAETLRISGDMSGSVETWVKWGWKSTACPDLDDQDSWLTVSKERWQRRYLIQPNALQPLMSDQWPATYFAVEATQLLIQSQPHWTIGMEVTGDPNTENIPALLHRAIEAFCRDCDLVAILASSKTMGYPEFLGAL